MNVSRCLAALMALSAGVALAHGTAPAVQTIPATLQVHGELTPLDGVADLKFREFFRLPIGPRGLEPSPKLLSLDGKRVRLIGYMVRAELPAVGLLILAPLPVTLGDEDESYADDLPASAVYVHLSETRNQIKLPYMPGLMTLAGVLQLGSAPEVDGRRSNVRLLLDDETSSLLAEPPVPPSFSRLMNKLQRVENPNARPQ